MASSSSSEQNQQQAAATPSSSASDSVQSNSWERVERKFSNKSASEYFDPCQDFADRSLKCMKRNAFDREMCHDYFQSSVLHSVSGGYSHPCSRSTLLYHVLIDSPGLIATVKSNG
ncbi:uncharacterized protein BO66DRAFT_145711 [Aspergillus aculeatinus CBS 121060]|uniref:Uncharacterized protein n=1 Tax=Aspergillus aculeatinus CBS 121060 TaxID=1448322 RepID=A0ACD1HLG5_9EURO|nr:hypothetical protein BO66DRAFT_145711 [Aspergillus aculeatinus CBS 121060]RAH74284.1 hypothetical protein BO66DRAFT_145711 [Aspergillus aculeatinus CBS 121060]